MKKIRMIKRCLARSFLGVGILMTALAVFENPAQAETIHGEVVAVKDGGRSFTLKPSNSSVEEQFDIVMLPDTKFEKMSSLNELAMGDEVLVDAEKNSKSGIWAAHSIKILKAQLYEEVLPPKT